MNSIFASIEDAIADLKAGKMIILVDDEDRENEGDLVIAADCVSAQAINFMTKFGRGLVCLPMDESMIEHLQLPLMAEENRSPYGTAFTVSIEAAQGVSTGISAADRAHTIKVAVDPQSQPKDLIKPGHIFPLKAQKQGVLARAGHTEGCVDLARLAGLKPAAVLCEILNEDGSMSRRDDLSAFAKKHGLLMATIKDLIHYRIKRESLVEVAASSTIPTMAHGDFDMTVFTNCMDKAEHFSLFKPSIKAGTDPLVRIHSECITGDIFGSCKCDCGAQLQRSLDLIDKEGGLLIYLRQEGRGIGLTNKLKAYALQEQGFDTVEANLELGLPADARDYAMAFQILRHFGISSLRLLTNNPQKIEALEHYGLNISERIPLVIQASQTNRNYLKTKQVKFGHLFQVE